MDYLNFIYEIVNEFLSFPNYYQDIADLLDATIDDYVGHNDIEENKKIVMTFTEDVYDAIRLYEFHLGNACDLHKGTKSKFYQQLAYVSLFVKLYPQIKSIVDTSSSSISDDDIEFSWNDINSDIVDMYHKTIQSYNNHEIYDDIYSDD
jgi:hypothetical protein